jgi:ABC-type multidrug transport system ATPase subunit
MGPSGAGKTSLLHVLAGVLPQCSGQELRGVMSGALYASGALHDAAFVGQDDTFHAHLSVRETLELAAKLRLAGTSEATRRERVADVLRQLHLLHCCESRVGSARERGISGGERRRLALGCELVGNPTLVFADEPTSGLDAFQAERMMVVLGALAREGRTVAPRNELRARAPRQDSSVVLNVPRACPRFGRRWS